jgi:hypothetical protein
MKAILLTPVLALGLTGCMMLPTAETKPVAANASATIVVKKPVISSDDINDANAQEMSIALNAELDQAQASALITADKPPEQPKK